ncbi:MAG: heavy-metal-associated domain-containing protein [Fuerstiella sp.]|nr:heavy-metal-associated domain-containing protein [Fuerstiella sp.]MCP4855111.1 heavy-metal-associated domain-containing protein [Fuerstiella sp.]
MQEALTSLPGVAKFDADTKTGIATVEVDDAQFDSEKAIAALADVGFPDSTIVTE